MKVLNMEKYCRLCGCKNMPLKQSHIVSKMFYNALKKKSPTGIMREFNNPNKSIQDGLKIPFLCASCEELFSKYETYFSNKVYMETVENDGIIKFDSNDDSISYFLLSISWRILKYSREEMKLKAMNLKCTDLEVQKIDEVIEVWRKILVTENMEEVKKYQQFIIPTKKLEFFENMPERVHECVFIDFKAFGDKDTFKFAFTIVQVPYFIFVTTVWGQTKKMSEYLLGKVIQPYRNNLADEVIKILEDKHYNKFYNAYKNLSQKQMQVIANRKKKHIK